MLLSPPPATWIPPRELPETTLRPAGVPEPTVLLGPVFRTIPLPELGTAAVPEAFVPTKFPCTVFPLELAPEISIPMPVVPLEFPATALQAPVQATPGEVPVVPPMIL